MEIVGNENSVGKNRGGKAEGIGGTREEAEGMEISSGAGLERASATRFSMPGTCTTELVNSAR